MKCFWCEGGSGVALADKVLDRRFSEEDGTLIYRPCSRCAEQWGELAVVLEVILDYEGDRPPISHAMAGDPYYPTGRMVGLDPEAVPTLEKGSISLLLHGEFEGYFGDFIRKRVQQDGRE